jgi:hypothetical protein
MSVERILHAVLYEGLALYPYRPSSLENLRRFPFGALYPRDWAALAHERSAARVEHVAVPSGDRPSLAVEVRFLQLGAGARGGEAMIHAPVAPLVAGLHRSVRQHVGELELELEVETTVVAAPGGLRVAVAVRNLTPLDPEATRDDAIDRAAASLHVIVRVRGARMVSSIDPPAELTAAVTACRCDGLYPVLAGEDTTLASPIDERLTLRILAMTEEEQREAAFADPRIAELVRRTKELGVERTAHLHRRLRGNALAPGMRVRLHPAGRAGALDLVLDGRLATVSAVERDYDGGVHVAVTIDDDAGAASFPGHRLFFRPDEVEVLR